MVSEKDTGVPEYGMHTKRLVVRAIFPGGGARERTLSRVLWPLVTSFATATVIDYRGWTFDSGLSHNMLNNTHDGK